MKVERFPLTLTPLTPLHVGDGSQLEAYEYAVVGGRFHRLSLNRLLARLTPEEQERLNVCIERDLTGLRRFVREHFGPEIAEYSAAASPRFRDVYEKNLDRSANQLIVSPFIRSMGAPFIPGSSLKGALRTALLDALIPTPITERKAATLEARTLGYMNRQGDRPNIPRDPLKGLRVSDVAFPAQDITAERIETRAKQAGRLHDLSLQTLQEVSASVVTGRECTLSGEVRILPDFLNRETERLKQGPAWLAKACNAFYRDRVLAAEERYFKGVRPVEKVYETIRSAIGPDDFLIRLGWGSGLNGVSLNLRTASPCEPKTRKLIDGRIPLGWLRVRFA